MRNEKLERKSETKMPPAISVSFVAPSFRLWETSSSQRTVSRRKRPKEYDAGVLELVTGKNVS